MLNPAVLKAWPTTTMTMTAQSTSPICPFFCLSSPHQCQGRTMTIKTDGIIANGGHLGGGGKCWTTAILGKQTTPPMIPSISWNGGHNSTVVMRGVDLWSVYHQEYRVLMLCISRASVPTACLFVETSCCSGCGVIFIVLRVAM